MNLDELRQLAALLKRLESERIRVFYALGAVELLSFVEELIREKQLEQEKPK